LLINKAKISLLEKKLSIINDIRNESEGVYCTLYGLDCPMNWNDVGNVKVTLFKLKGPRSWSIQLVRRVWTISWKRPRTSM